MESEDVIKKMQFEARRVAAAFGVERWEDCFADIHRLGLEGYSYSSESGLEWGVSANGPDYITVHWQNGGAEIWFDKGTITSIELKEHIELEEHVDRHWLARGLYQLGFENEGLLILLPALTTHEKAELRLNFPREFWPQKWIDEDGEIL